MPSQPYTYAGSNQRINFARSLVLATSPQWEAATELLNTVITKSRLANQKSVSIEATGTLGWLYEQSQQWSKAGEFTRQALGSTDNDNQYQWEWQLGRILQHQSQPDFAKSQAAYDRAILALAKTRRHIQIVNPDAQFSLRDNVEPLYRESIDLSLRRQQPLSKIIDRVDALKLVELENFLQCQLDVYKPINKFAEDAGAVVFYPVILNDRLEVILQLAGTKYQRFVVPFTRAQLEQTIATFRQNLTQPQYGWNDVAASQLYDWLIRPAQKYLTPATKQFKTEYQCARSAVLSACETATGDRRAALGLADTAIRSGAGSTLASMWSVDDRATTNLMQNFYGSLTQPDGVTKAQALQVAQRATRQQYPHPYYWASFVLVGNWL